MLSAVISKVEIRIDDGKWETATLTKADEPFCWALWQHDLKLTAGKHTLAVRATDSDKTVQPEKTPWNAKGYLQNGWQSVEVEVA